jgi:hypothetical protein
VSFAFTALFALGAQAVPLAHAAPGNVVISQVYGGGGTTYPNDYIELHNRGTVEVDLTGWSVQYSTATGTNWIGTLLGGSIPAGGYYLVREGFGGATQMPLPTPDALGTIQMDATAGKVALVNSTLALFGTNPTSATIVDLLGYGATASAYEGTPMAALLAAEAGVRNGAGCTDTDDNAADFVASSPSPRHSATSIHRCPLTLTYVAGLHGDITGTKVQTVPYGGTGTEVEAVGETGYHFEAWDDAYPTANRTDTNVLDNITATATFAINVYSVKYTAGPNGSITGDLDQAVAHGGSASQVEAVPATGYHFGGWSDAYPTANRTDTGVIGPIDVTADFDPDEFTLQYSAGPNGSITGEANQTVSFGADGTEVEAVPEPGYHFDKWSDDYPTAKRTDTNVSENVDVTATFANDLYTINVVVDPSSTGAVAKSPDLTNYTFGTNLQLTATAIPGYHFDHWTGTVISGANPLTVPMNSDVSLTAHFVPNAMAGQMVISQFFGGGGEGGPSHDYVELYNRGNGPVSVAGWSIQYAAASGANWSSTDIAGIVQPGRYLLIRLAGSGTGTGALALPDIIGTMNLGPEGKIALVSNRDLIQDACPSGIPIVDKVGYGAIDCSEDLPTGAITSTTAGYRGQGGCDESDHNQFDFGSGAPSPRNSLSSSICSNWLSVEPAPTELSLAVGGANPARGRVRFSLGLPDESTVRASVTDIQGRRIASILDDHLPAGRHELSWDGTSESGEVRSGLYFLAVQVMGRRLIRSFVLVR